MTALFETTLYVSVTALFILLFKQLFKNRMSAKWHVLIWLILAVRMVVPSFPESSFSVFNVFDVPEKQQEVQTDFSELVPEADVNTAPATPTQPQYQTVLPQTDTSGQISADFIASLVRWCGMALLLLYFVLVYIINLAKVKKHKKAVDNEAFQILNDCKNTVGVKRKVSIVYYGKSPMLMGEIRPVIVLPEDYSDKEKRDIIIHELCHLKNGDIFSLWLAVFLLCTSWYNPVIWFCFFTFRRDIEVYCDRRVLSYTDNKKEYAALLVKTALKKNNFIAGTNSLQNGEKEVERRIKYMAYFKKPKVVLTIVIAVIAVIISAICLTNANSKKNNAEDKEASLYDSYSFDVEQCKPLVNIKNGCSVKETIQLKGKEFRYIVYHVQSDMSPDDLTPKYSYYNVFVFKGDDLIKIIEADADPRVYGFNTANTVLEADVNFDSKNDILVCTPAVGFEEYIIYLQKDNGFEDCEFLSKMNTIHVNTEAKLFSGIYDNKDYKSFKFSDGKIEYLDYVDKAYTDKIKDNTIELREYAGVEVYPYFNEDSAHVLEEYEKTDDGIIESTPNFLLKQTPVADGEEYYYEIHDNNGKTILSDTSARCPVFNHLDGSLYKLQTGFGTFAWQSIYINVETGWKSEPYDNPFYLTNGVIAHVYDIDTFTDDGKRKTGEITFIGLYDLYKRENIDIIDAEFLKESSVTYQIEYEDNTHITVTYYTENGQKENRKVIEVPPLSGAMTEAD